MLNGKQDNERCILPLLQPKDGDCRGLTFFIVRNDINYLRVSSFDINYLLVHQVQNAFPSKCYL